MGDMNNVKEFTNEERSLLKFQKKQQHGQVLLLLLLLLLLVYSYSWYCCIVFVRSIAFDWMMMILGRITALTSFSFFLFLSFLRSKRDVKKSRI